MLYCGAMKKVVILLFLVFMAVVLVNRRRLFVRDPLGKVERNGVRVEGARVFINFANDVLVEEPGHETRYMVQHWNKLPGVPKWLTCVRWMACWTEGNQAELVPLGGSGVEMSNREVFFVDGRGVPVKVTLR